MKTCTEIRKTDPEKSGYEASMKPVLMRSSHASVFRNLQTDNLNRGGFPTIHFRCAYLYLPLNRIEGEE